MNARYTTKKNAIQNGADIEAFALNMADYDNRINVKSDYIEVIDIETDEIVDYANWIIITHNGEKFGEIANAEMINTYTFEDGTWIDTEELEITGLPLYQKRMLNR